MVNKIESGGGISGEGSVEIVTSGRDGLVKLWDIRQKTPVLILEPESKGNY